MGASECLNENPVRLVLRFKTTEELKTQGLRRNILKGEILFSTDNPGLWVTTSSANKITEGQLIKLGHTESDIMSMNMVV